MSVGLGLDGIRLVLSLRLVMISCAFFLSLMEYLLVISVMLLVHSSDCMVYGSDGWIGKGREREKEEGSSPELFLTFPSEHLYTVRLFTFSWNAR